MSVMPEMKSTTAMTRTEIVAVDVVLTAESLAELFGMELLRADGSLDERLEQRLHNLIT